MKKKINIQFVFISITAIILTLIISTTVSYEVFKTEVMEDLRTYSHVLRDTGVFDDPEHISYDSKADNLRITLVEADGTVAYDSNAKVTEMENHDNRPEIEEAFLDGEGKAIRTSKTVGESTFYYAVKLENGTVLRVAKQAGNIWSVFASSLPISIGLALILALLSVVLAHILTKSIVAPIEQMANDMDHVESLEIYKELRPFITTIHQQHEDILRNADMRQEFTANVSHELKTPLTSISGYSELIESGMANEKDTIRFAGEIHQNANRLLTLINDIIRLSELDVSNMEITFEDMDLYQIAEKCVDLLQVNANNHDVTISLHGESTMIHANREMMNELVYNLCDNAIRYNKKGGSVSVNVTMVADRPALVVEDTGIGIPKEHQSRIFERFYRVDKSRSKLTGGTGLGLAIVKHIVAQHKAQMELVSEREKGTKITVTFPQ